MEKELISKISSLALNKSNLLKNSILRYFILSTLAGIYVGFGIILIFSIGAPLKDANSPALKLVMGASFALALSLVIFAGSELFTGNNMVMTIGTLDKKTNLKNTLYLWLISYAGNFFGALLISLAMLFSGLITKGSLNSFIVSTAATKMSSPFIELFFRGLLCNILVCLAVWMSIKASSESAKLILIFWCLFGFIGAAFEHSIANMTLLTMSLLAPHTSSVSLLGLVNNLVPVTLGNIVGGVLLGAAYFYIASTKQKTEV